MKIHEFEIFGGQTQTEEGNQEWPDYVTLTIPRSVHVDLISFLAKSLNDPKMEVSRVKLVGKLDHTGEKSVADLFGPTPNEGKNEST